MSRLIFSPSALDDISRLRAFLADKDAVAARNAISLTKLAQRPQIGRPAGGADLPAGAREWSIRFGRGGYVALYHWDGDTTLVLAIRHAREAGY